MTTPPITPETKDAGQIVMPTAPRRPNHWRSTILTLVILIAAGFCGYYGWLWYQNRNGIDGGTSATANSAVSNTDTVTTQLRSVSNSTDTSTIKAEIADTPTGDIATELDNIDAEVTGL